MDFPRHAEFGGSFVLTSTFKTSNPNSYQAYLWTPSLPHWDDVDDPDEP